MKSCCHLDKEAVLTGEVSSGHGTRFMITEHKCTLFADVQLEADPPLQTLPGCILDLVAGHTSHRHPGPPGVGRHARRSPVHLVGPRCIADA